MALPRIIPSLLLKERGFVKTIKYKNPQYIGDPFNTVKIFNSLEADEIMITDIEATKKGIDPDFDFLKEIASECFMPISYGGGIKNVDHIGKLIQCGIEKVSLNAAVMDRPAFLKEASNKFGTSTIIAVMDIKKNMFGSYGLYSYSKTKKPSITLVGYAKQLEELGAGELFINNVDLEGTMSGYDATIIAEIAENINIPIVVNGGAKSLIDMGNIIKRTKISGAAAGSVFVYHGRNNAVLISYPNQREIKEIFE